MKIVFLIKHHSYYSSWDTTLFLFFLFETTLKIQIIRLHIIQTMTRVKRSSYNGYLAKGMVSDPMFNEVNSTIALSLPLLLWTISKDRNSFSSPIPGLSASIGEVHDMAISTTFHAKLMSNLPCNLASTMFRISPLLTIGVTHSWCFLLMLLLMLSFRWSIQVELSQSSRYHFSYLCFLFSEIYYKNRKLKCITDLFFIGKCYQC